jgi:hypothetical protein
LSCRRSVDPLLREEMGEGISAASAELLAVPGEGGAQGRTVLPRELRQRGGRREPERPLEGVAHHCGAFGPLELQTRTLPEIESEHGKLDRIGRSILESPGPFEEEADYLVSGAHHAGAAGTQEERKMAGGQKLAARGCRAGADSQVVEARNEVGQRGRRLSAQDRRRRTEHRSR